MSPRLPTTRFVLTVLLTVAVTGAGFPLVDCCCSSRIDATERETVTAAAAPEVTGGCPRCHRPVANSTKTMAATGHERPSNGVTPACGCRPEFEGVPADPTPRRTEIERSDAMVSSTVPEIVVAASCVRPVDAGRDVRIVSRPLWVLHCAVLT